MSKHSRSPSPVLVDLTHDDEPSVSAPDTKKPRANAMGITKFVIDARVGYRERACIRVDILLHHHAFLPADAPLVQRLQAEQGSGYAGVSTVLAWSPCSDPPMIVLGKPGHADAIALPYQVSTLNEADAAWFVQTAYADWYELHHPGAWSPTYGDDDRFKPWEELHPKPCATATKPALPLHWPRVTAQSMSRHTAVDADGDDVAVYFFPAFGVVVCIRSARHRPVSMTAYAMKIDKPEPLADRLLCGASSVTDSHSVTEFPGTARPIELGSHWN